MTDMPAAIDRPSPNHDERAAPPDMIILHYTGMTTRDAALDRLCDPAAKVSAHYLIDEDGGLFRLVDEERRAWHAGAGSWQGGGDINGRSIGIELVNAGHEWGYAPFPVAQINALTGLLRDIISRRSIARTHVLGHSDIAPRRKEDPGEKFPWDTLAEAGLALGTYDGPPDESLTYEEALSMLTIIGYDAAPGDHAAGLLAFQRRFVPAALGQGVSPLTKAALRWAHERFNRG